MVRLVSGVLLAGVVVAAILVLPILPLLILASVFAGLAAQEYLRVIGTSGMPRQFAGVAATCVLCAFAGAGVRLDAILVFMIALAWVGLEVLGTGRRIERVASDLFAPIYIGFPLGMLVMVHRLGGPSATLLIVATVIVSDSAQYYTGRALGRRPLAPAISPKKTIEGAAGGLVCGTLFFTALGGLWAFPQATLAALAGMGATIVALGICGDLFESRLKRTAGVKDSSSLIPGHGGMLDRIDALLFAAPGFYLFVRNVTS